VDLGKEAPVTEGGDRPGEVRLAVGRVQVRLQGARGEGLVEVKPGERGKWFVDRMSLPASFAENDYILLWCLPDYDDLIRQALEEFQWGYYYEVFRELKETVPKAVLAAWRSTDPACVEVPWERVLDDFIKGRATQLGLRPRVSVRTSVQHVRRWPSSTETKSKPLAFIKKTILVRTVTG
jgi:hypothetical protein